MRWISLPGPTPLRVTLATLLLVPTGARAQVKRHLMLPSVLAGGVAAQTAGDSLAAGFRTPPPSARPRVWWHWMNGNVTEHGIDEDFAWMKRVGLAGVQNFDAALNTPKLVETLLPYMSEGWRSAFRHAVTRADSLGLEFTIASSPGWSETGGPWVKPEQAMKKLVWSERVVPGGSPVAGPLPQPPSVSGPFQDIGAARREIPGFESVKVPDLYRDAAVVAYRIPPAERDARPTITTSRPVDTAAFTDGDRTTTVELPFGPDSTAWVQFTYVEPQTMRAATIVGGRVPQFGGPPRTSQPNVVQTSDDGTHFRTLAALPYRGAPEQTVAFPATTARFFRVLFRQPPTGGGIPGFFRGQPVKGEQIAELSLGSAAKVNRFEDKAGWSTAAGLDEAPTPAVSPDATIATSDVVGLTDRMRPDGTLDWTPPPGRWRVLRLGWSLIGTTNHPASPAGTGLEVDKLNRDDVKDFLDKYLDNYERAVGPQLMGKHGVRYMLTDSYEAGAANWTDDMIAEFTKRRGYDPRPWLPVLTGRVVGSAAESDRFLWDFRRTLGDLIAENHYGELSAILHEHGMGRYGESHESGRAFIGDGMEVKKSADVPMGATWYARSNGPGHMLPDIRESASVAHLYGQNIAAAESFTVGGFNAAYNIAPEMLKPTADQMMANGLNRFVIHTSVHQPLDTPGPGVGLGPFGEWFTRHETWAEQAAPWVSYLARSSYLLQQGRFAADVVWLYGEDDNITHLYADHAPAVPAGYAYDFINGDALRNLLSVKDGRLVAPSGASYRMLVLDPVTRRMTVPTLRKIRDLVGAGGVVVGAKPQETPSLADDTAEFRRLVGEVWGGGAGSGRVFPTIASAISALGPAPDVDFGADTALAFLHRTLPDGEIYFVANLADAPVASQASFRVSGRAPQLWRADDGSVRPLSYRMEDGRTVVPLSLGPHDAVFVVFRQRASTPSRTVPQPVAAALATLRGPWHVSFPSDRGAPPSVDLPELAWWTDNADPGVEYFSGTATYTKDLDVPAAWRSGGGRLVLDLGAVKNVAEVRVNGQPVGIAWKAPFRLDITDAAKTGPNRLEIRVSNLWTNRLIGDLREGTKNEHAFAVFDPYTKDSPLLPSGLLGPVRVIRVTGDGR